MGTFGENLRDLRVSRGYSQFQFARIINSNQITVSSWERDARMPPVETIRSIANAFHAPLTALLPIADTGYEEDSIKEVVDAFHHDPKIRLLFDKARFLTSEDLDAVLGVVNAITRERDQDV